MEIMFSRIPSTSFRPVRRRMAGFTLVEVVIAGCLLSVLIAGSFAALTQINRWATSARLRTLALAVAQQRIDFIQTLPWQTVGVRPAVLPSDSITESNLPLNNDAFNSATSLASAYTNLDTPLNSTRTTVLSYPSTRTMRAVVTVTFTYRNRPHSVVLTTLRATDSI